MRPTTAGTRNAVTAAGTAADVLLEIWSDSHDLRYEPGSANPYTATRRDNGLKLAAPSPEELVPLMGKNFCAQPVLPGVTVPGEAGENLEILRQRGPGGWDWWYAGGLYHGKPPWADASTVRSDDWEAALEASWHEKRVMTDAEITRLMPGHP